MARKKKSGRSQANGQGTKTVLPSGRVRWRLRDSEDQTLASGTADDDKAANEAIAAAISPHDLRHTCGSLWLRNRRPIEVVSRDLGHQDINVTYKIYRHVLKSEREQHVMDLFLLRKSA